nr:B62 [uncultured bacterium]
MNRIKVWPHITIMAGVIALVAVIGVAFWLKREQTASAEELPAVARIQRVEGEVAFSDSLPKTDATDPNAEWVAAIPNQPISVGDRIYTRDNSHASLAFSGRNFARLDPNTSLDVVSLEDHRTQLALRDGAAMFEVGELASDDLFEVATPYGAVNFDEPGLYNVGFDNNGGVLVSVLSGLAQVVGLAGSGQINKGEMLTLVGQSVSEVVLSRLNGQDAGNRVDDYYRYQYPNSYDGRYNNYDAYLNDPYYYDPYRTGASYKYASSSIPGLNDLDHFGDWLNVAGYGNAWRPRVDSGWVPYQQGQWTNDYPYGPTWVSSEPWGYAPYHYGRWASVNNQWYWIPDGVNSTQAYAPALVGFVNLNDGNQVGWVPLGLGDSYAPRYYDSNWQPRYLTQANISPGQFINFGIPGAVTVLPVDAWGRPIDLRNIRRIDSRVLASLRPTLDPLTLTPLRNAVIHSAWGRGKIDLPPGIAKKLRDTQVYVGGDIRESPSRKDLAKSMRVQRVSDNARNQKFKVRDEREQSQQVDQARKQELERQNVDAKPGDKKAQKEVRRLEQQEQKETRAQGSSEKNDRRKVQQQPQGEQVASPAKQQSKGAAKQERKQKSAGGGQVPNAPEKAKAKSKGKGKP